MSLVGKKKSWNTKKTGTKIKTKPRPVAPPIDLSVRDCLVWNSADGKKGGAGPGEAQNGESFVYRSVLVKRNGMADAGRMEENENHGVIQRKEIPYDGIQIQHIIYI